ncbi:hypothetical protein KJ765_03680 [Candidatus Micrarchaeota archaeon]|nr:hypothetical protein [Candidatus Micrarchaeota archaeon]
MNSISSIIKFIIGIVFTMLFRLLHMPLPNLEPIMGTTIPFARKMGKYAGMTFAFLALVSFDFITGRIGAWTVYTGIAYSAVGYFAAGYFAKRKLKLKNTIPFAVGATLFYDALTAVLFGWQFGQPLSITMMGQIPFTLYHLLGNIAAVGILTPLINSAIVENKALDAVLDRWIQGVKTAVS